jgi:hypothetical protein
MELVVEVLVCGMLPTGCVACVAAAVLVTVLLFILSVAAFSLSSDLSLTVVVNAGIPQSFPRHGHCVGL